MGGAGTCFPPREREDHNMSKLLKLTRQHVDGIYRLHALGHQAVAITELLAEGIVTDDGAELCPVKVGESAVRHHLSTDGGEEAVREWRLRLYGDVYASPLAYAGERMRQLQRIFDDARGELDRLDQDGNGRPSLRREVVTILDKASALMAQIDPDMTITRIADGTRATISGKVDSATLDRIATKLRAAIGAGVIDLDIPEAPAESTDPGPAQGNGPGPGGTG